jgi:hypothetical protein
MDELSGQWWGWESVVSSTEAWAQHMPWGGLGMGVRASPCFVQECCRGTLTLAVAFWSLGECLVVEHCAASGICAVQHSVALV